MRYPEAAADGPTEVLHGVSVADPYRWLEEADSDATRDWLEDQRRLLEQARSTWTGRQHLAARLEALTPGLVSSPAVRGGRQFFQRREPGQDHPVYWVREPDGAERALVDPLAIDPTSNTVLDAALPSYEGDRLAYLLSGGGREESSLFVLDVDSGAVLDGPVFLGRGGTVAWARGGQELFCVRRLPADLLPAGEEQFHRRVWRHRVGEEPARDVMLFGHGRDLTTYYGLNTSPDGRWLLVSAALGTAPRNDLYLLDVAKGTWTTLQEDVDWETFGFLAGDGRLYLMTNRDAPRWRLCVADPSVVEPEWEELLGQDTEVLTDVAVTDAAVVAVHRRDVVSHVTVHDRLGGRRRAEVDLPGLGEADVSAAPTGGAKVWIGYTDYLNPRRVLEHDIPAGRTVTWAEPPGAPSLRARVESVTVSSSDGTGIPVFLMRPAGLSGPAPTILYGYGGFNISLSPAYSALFATWVEAGGQVAVANLRGGGEYGEEWHRLGMRQHKQNVFDDFLAAAEWLAASGLTTTDQLGIFGGSNGGLLVGAALTQRPELFRAVVCSAPLLDMVRYERFGLGRTWNDEYGTTEDPEELAWLLSYSPYHHVAAGTRYPAVLFTVFDGDTRVDPLHARKMCAALQGATSASPDDRPVLLRLETDVGHGARAVSRSVQLQADELGFLAAQLGLVQVR
jgi:prolyl oligopeptidase